jgi:hypothetical protein
MEHCVTLLQALASIPGTKCFLNSSGKEYRNVLYSLSSGLVAELVEHNLHRRSPGVQEHTR